MLSEVSINPFKFSWTKPDKGFYWDFENCNMNIHGNCTTLKKRSINNPILAENTQSSDYLDFNPLEETPTLFIKFSELQGTPEDIINFANSYGRLISHPILLGEKEIPYLTHKNNNNHFYNLYGESLIFWQREIEHMKRTFQIWEWILNEDKEKLKMVINWLVDDSGEKHIFYNLGNEKYLRNIKSINSNRELLKVVSNTNIPFSFDFYENELNIHCETLLKERQNKELLTHFRCGDVFLPAQFLIQQIINTKIEKYIPNPKILMGEKNEPILCLIPDCLIGALWTQFIMAFTGKKRYKRCAVCGEWEHVTEKNKNWSKHPSCATKVRVAKHRRNKKHKEGTDNKKETQ
ncbi:hypothetical protein [Oceanirhabdus seepicola]|uniref:Uncharacterized protein n=1 Tax=Oceanirhabdus seepicola TaxID=2828781 RepID=A0A9J6P454_9CLOT|nr:hypothetical protein [Oceanirhabdus seepicola]MCM1991331.1 hypothetical protein [Oceanirhabdus seepicola]